MWKIKSSLNRIYSVFTFFIYTGDSTRRAMVLAIHTASGTD